MLLWEFVRYSLINCISLNYVICTAGTLSAYTPDVKESRNSVELRGTQFGDARYIRCVTAIRTRIVDSRCNCESREQTNWDSSPITRSVITDLRCAFGYRITQFGRHFLFEDTQKNGLAKVSKNLAGYKFENNFIGLSKLLRSTFKLVMSNAAKSFDILATSLP